MLGVRWTGYIAAALAERRFPTAGRFGIRRTSFAAVEISDSTGRVGAASGRDKGNVQIASDGETGLKLAKEFHTEVVLLDIGLPGIDLSGVHACPTRHFPTYSPCRTGGLKPQVLAKFRWTTI